MRSNFEDIIEFPEETPQNEYKSWIDLDDPIVRANIARHLAALANHEGGHLVFGFQDDLSLTSDRPSSLHKYNRDTSAIGPKRKKVGIFTTTLWHGQGSLSIGL